VLKANVKVLVNKWWRSILITKSVSSGSACTSYKTIETW